VAHGDEDLPRLAAVVERLRRELTVARAEADVAAVVAMARGALMERHHCSAAEAARQLDDMAAAAGLPPHEMAAAVLRQEPPAPPPEPEQSYQLEPADPFAVAAAERARDGAELVDALHAQLLDRFGVIAAAVWLLEPDGSLEMLGQAGLGGTESSRWRRLPAQFDSPQQRVAGTGEELWWPAGPPPADQVPTLAPWGGAVGSLRRRRPRRAVRRPGGFRGGAQPAAGARPGGVHGAVAGGVQGAGPGRGLRAHSPPAARPRHPVDR